MTSRIKDNSLYIDSIGLVHTGAEWKQMDKKSDFNLLIKLIEVIPDGNGWYTVA